MRSLLDRLVRAFKPHPDDPSDDLETLADVKYHVQRMDERHNREITQLRADFEEGMEKVLKAAARAYGRQRKRAERELDELDDEEPARSVKSPPPPPPPSADPDLLAPFDPRDKASIRRYLAARHKNGA